MDNLTMIATTVISTVGTIIVAWLPFQLSTQRKVNTIASKIDTVEHEMQPNSGKSIADKVNRLVTNQNAMHDKLDEVALSLLRQSDAIQTVSQKSDRAHTKIDNIEQKLHTVEIDVQTLKQKV